MKVIEITCNTSEKHNVGMLLTKKEREIIYYALEEYTQKYKRKRSAKNLLNYMHKHLPI